MAYFLKKTTPSKKGIYLQIYDSFHVPGVGKRNKSFQKIGYVSDSIENGIEDPIAYYTEYVKALNAARKEENQTQIDSKSVFNHVGHFLPKAMFDYLDMDKVLNIIANNFGCKYNFADMFKTLCYSQIISPGSKHKAFDKIIPCIFNSNEYSYDQILDALDFIGGDYHKYIELINKKISKNWTRNLDKVYFDCTNYFFEIDLEKSYLKKGYSKENRHLPLLGQALMLDADQIPIDTEFYPGNESETTFLRNRIEDMKSRNNIKGRVIQVADKGLNCAANIYAAVVEAKDGYIFSKGLKGTKIPDAEKKRILQGGDRLNDWISVRNEKKELIYAYKILKDIETSGKNKGETLNYRPYKYQFLLNPEDKKQTEFTVNEMRIVTYNPSLATKQKAEIHRQVEKLQRKVAYREAIKKDIGDAVKYLNIEAVDQDGKKIKIATSLKQDKINEDLAFCGYNMLVTSEINADPNEVYKIYHNLWRIEESFRVLKTHLESRPVYLSKKERIYGHFLINYICLTIMRLLELKIFEDEIAISQLFSFIRQYNVTKDRAGDYINCSTTSSTYEKIKKKLGISKLGNLYLSKKDIENILSTEL